MGELRFGVALDIGLQLIPVSLIVANLLARGADGNETAQNFDLGKGFLQFLNQLLAFLLRALSFCDAASREQEFDVRKRLGWKTWTRAALRPTNRPRPVAAGHRSAFPDHLSGKWEIAQLHQRQILRMDECRKTTSHQPGGIVAQHRLMGR